MKITKTKKNIIPLKDKVVEYHYQQIKCYICKKNFNNIKY